MKGLFGETKKKAPGSLVEMAQMFGSNLTDMLPSVMKNFGMESEEGRIANALEGLDITNKDSVMLTYNNLNSINPKYGMKFATDVIPVMQKLTAGDKFDASAKAKRVKYNELLKKHSGNEALASEEYLAWEQKNKQDVASAGVSDKAGLNIFNQQVDSRNKTKEKLGNIKTTLNQFIQAKAGSPAAEKLSSQAINGIFGSSVKASSEITRIASAGGLVENIGDFVNEVLTGVKTQKHYDAFIKVLEQYYKEQERSYNDQTSLLKDFNNSLGINLDKNSDFFNNADPLRKLTDMKKTDTLEEPEIGNTQVNGVFNPATGKIEWK